MSKGEHQPMHGLSSLIEIKQRRLQVLREQAAQYGPQTSAGVILEIEDLATELSSLHNQLTTENADAANSRFRILETQITHLEARIHAVTQPIPTNTTQIFRTNISQAFWCAANNKGTPFEPARMPFSATESGKEIAWFDELFRGGLCVPTRGSRPLTVLVAGPPGGGKTTLVLELCYRLAKNEAHNSRGLFSLYISVDQDSDRLIENATRLGYQQIREYVFDHQIGEEDKHRRGLVAVWGRDKILEFVNPKEYRSPGQRQFRLQQVFEGAINGLNEMLEGYQSDQRFTPDIIVIDSLNIVEGTDRGDFFQQFQSVTSSGGKIVVFVLDSSTTGDAHAIWEYACDVVIRLDYGTVNNYYMRTIEVVKARYQSHIWGKHQLKIYEESPPPGVMDEHWEDKVRRNHPYRTEGGIFIYPSIHYYLSLYKRRGPTANVRYAETRPRLDGVLKEGFPEGRCTAFIGTRGGHKSHFGYLHLLHRILDHPMHADQPEEAALIISLRDDEKMTLKTLDEIHKTEFQHQRLSLQKLQRDDQLEILYFHPGYITPEEFFHRMFISIQRLKKPGRKLTVLFNSVDQLASRFPLCAKEDIFIPGIIEFLSGEDATSIFIAVDEIGQPTEQYGLLPMADLILSFYPHRFPYEQYRENLIEMRKLDIKNTDTQRRIQEMDAKYSGGMIEAITLQVVRFAGGEQAGARGVLELVKVDEPRLYESPGLQFTPLGPKIQPLMSTLPTRPSRDGR